MGYSEEGQKHYNLKRLWGKQREVIRLVSSGLYNVNEVASIVGLSPRTVSNIINSPLGKSHMEILQGAKDSTAIDVANQIDALTPIALAIQTDIMLNDETDPKLRASIADKLLDRGGHVPVNKNLNVNVNRGLTDDDLAAIKKRAKELRGVEVEPE